MNVKVAVYDCTAVDSKDPRQRPKELTTQQVTADSQDMARNAAKLLLTRQGWAIRSLSWGPGAKKGEDDRLIAYVVKTPGKERTAP